jgi:hypothetical protein
LETKTEKSKVMKAKKTRKKQVETKKEFLIIGVKKSVASAL